MYGAGEPQKTRGDDDTGALRELTARQLEVALVVGAGATNREAASTLFVTCKTIDFHLQQIYRKLGVRSRVELAILVTLEQGRTPSRSLESSS
jgi:DNA-binding NarL/FixJ family response regulator